LNPEAPAFLLQIDIWEMVGRGGPLTIAVLAILLFFSGFSWTIIFSKWNILRSARAADRRFLRAFRKASGLDAVMVASEQFKPAPLVSVFEFGYEEVHRQVKVRGSVTNKISLERSLQLGTSEELTKLERNMSWLATTASVSPFIGLFGTVLGIIRAVHDMSGTSMANTQAVMVGIAQALVATGVGLIVALPAVATYNAFVRYVETAASAADSYAHEILAWLHAEKSDKPVEKK
jgi:biopolymer transport protein TolQ